MRTRIFMTVAMLLIGIMCFTGCNTWDGAGKDVERTGEYMQGED